MSCAIDPISMEHQWRNSICSTIEFSPSQKANGAKRSIGVIFNGAVMAQTAPTAAALRYRSARLAAPSVGRRVSLQASAWRPTCSPHAKITHCTSNFLVLATLRLARRPPERGSGSPSPTGIERNIRATRISEFL
ncbi:hypothetical protein QA641_40085 [Bradyrhizobium sp. CB1650]|uniref:hypothetical protein n=1 Tax=Bradyrhizobium sp. CB1650 TaxID=3039153 RepID=UPI00243492A4|nr:hypothetical protein [Bradyrhizobium sp. CB1650]WGD51568.1 hypothetical protein QA641_40085 [Bradyrhizobium sp. CB1650]